MLRPELDSVAIAGILIGLGLATAYAVLVWQDRLLRGFVVRDCAPASCQQRRESETHTRNARGRPDPAMTSVVLRTAVRSITGACARARSQDAAGWRLGLALLIGLAPVVGGCTATPTEPSPSPSAAGYLIVAAPYQLLPPTPDLTAAAEALGKAEAGSLPQRAATAIAVRSVAAAIVRAPDGVQFAAFVVLFDDAVLSLPGGREGAIRSMNQQNTATSNEVDGVTIYTADRNEYGLASWLDGDFLVIVRANLRDLPAQHEPALIAVSRAFLDRKR